MYRKSSKVKVAQSNGLTFRDNPNYAGTILYKIPNETILTILNVHRIVDCFWISVEYRDLCGWVVADNGVGTTNVKIVSKPKRRYRKRAKKTDSP